ncbi:MAG: hypothetical protein ACRDTS_25455 [Mycobacterium sp.]
MDGQDNPAMSPERRRAAAIELRLGGWTYDRIAQRLGYYDRSHVNRDVRVEIERIGAEQRENALHLRDLIFERYERLIASSWEAALGGDPDAVEAVRKLTADEVKLLGLAAPVKVDLGRVRDVFAQLVGSEAGTVEDTGDPGGEDDPDDDA